MDTISPLFASDQDSQDNFEPEDLQTQTSWLNWWYRFTSPPEPPANASFEQRDAFRRGRLASRLMLIFTFVVILMVLLGIFGPNHTIVLSAAPGILILLVSSLLNKRGWIIPVGILWFLGSTSGICLSILSTPGGLAPETIPVFDLLIIGEVFVASLLPVGWVIVPTLFNIIFTIAALSSAHHTPALEHMLAVNRYGIIVRPIVLQIVVAGILWLQVQSASQANRRANRAEEIARLQRTVAKQTAMIANQKRQLDNSIRQIEFMLEQVANGNLDAHIPLTQGNVLWSIAGKLNNFVGRFKQLQQNQQESFQNKQKMFALVSQLEQAKQTENEYHHLIYDLEVLRKAVQKAKMERRPLWLPQNTKTSLGPLLSLLHRAYINDAESSMSMNADPNIYQPQQNTPPYQQNIPPYQQRRTSPRLTPLDNNGSALRNRDRIF